MGLGTIVTRTSERPEIVNSKCRGEPRFCNWLRRSLPYLGLLSMAAIMVFPFLLMVSGSLRPNYRYFTFPISIVPQNLSLSNYLTIVRRGQFARWLFNSCLVSGVSIAARLFFCSLAGYAFARGRFPGRDMIFWGLMIFLMVPTSTTVVPMYILLAKLGWVDTYLALVVPYATSIFGTFLMRQNMIAIPHDYDDAALIDGCSWFGVYWRVILPMSKPALATLAVIGFLEIWNDFLLPLVVMRSNEMRTITVGLATMSTIGGGQAGLIMAGATLVFLPTLIIFLVLQRYVVEGMTLAGIKG